MADYFLIAGVLGLIIMYTSDIEEINILYGVFAVGIAEAVFVDG